VTIVRVQTFPEAYLIELVEASYRRAQGSLRKPGRSSFLR
jgi:hypothetical protein